MFDVNTMIGIKAGQSVYDSARKTSAPDAQKELREIMGMIEAARERLDDLMIWYDARDEDTTELEKAVDALDEAADSLEDALGE